MNDNEEENDVIFLNHCLYLGLEFAKSRWEG